MPEIALFMGGILVGLIIASIILVTLYLRDTAPRHK